MNNIDYDYDKIIRMCENTGSYILDDLFRDIRRLKNDLDACQMVFHGKDSQPNNAITTIYKGFSKTIGYSRGEMIGTGISGILASAAKVINLAYDEAINDKRIMEERRREQERLKE